MKLLILIASVSLLTPVMPVCRADLGTAGPRQRFSLDLDWSFRLGDPAGAEQPDYDDRGWRTLDVPHDWSIEGPYERTNATQGSGGFLPAGIGWYRKHFKTAPSFANRQVTVQFDGVFMNATVFMNGKRITEHAYGYTSFSCDLTPFLAAAGNENVLAVRVANDTQPNSRWYTGSGIYRHVWATVTGPIHLAEWGVSTTSRRISADSAEVAVKTLARNETAAAARIAVRQDLVDPAGKVVGSSVSDLELPARGQQELFQTLAVARPELWSAETPVLYTVRTRLVGAGPAAETMDIYETPVGIRDIEYDPERGFLLNGKPVKMLGMCLHHDGGAVGAAVPLEIWERRLNLLKEMGCNSIRCSHNPPAPEFLDLCDRLGLLVMDEAFDEWTVAKGGLRGSYATLFNSQAEQDLRSMLQRDRNHPSVVMWSIGNEIPEQSSEPGVDLARKLTAICHAEDPSRPVTSACDNAHSPQPTLPGFLSALDVAGYNYIDRWGRFRELYFSEDHQRHPQFKLLGTEDVCVGGVRGSYFGSGAPDQAGPFPYASSMIRAEQLWKFNAIHDYVIGYFMWTGIDYLGEARSWPRKSASSGVLDTCGFPKDGYYLYQSQWTRQPMVHLFPHWNYPGEKGKLLPVLVYSNCRQVELQVNGRSLGTKSLVFPRPGSVRSWNDPTPSGTTADLHLSWDVPFEPGTVRAVGWSDGKVVAQDEIRTAGAPAAIALKCDRRVLSSAARGVAQIEVRILDADGNLVPTADPVVTFEIEGPGRIIGVDSGDPASHESYQGPQRSAFNGMVLAIVGAGRTAGHVTVTARAKDLRPATVGFEVERGSGVPSIP